MTRYGHNSLADKRLRERLDGQAPPEPPAPTGQSYPTDSAVASSGGDARRGPGRPRGGRFKRRPRPWEAALQAQQELEITATVKALCLANALMPKPLGPTDLAEKHSVKVGTVMAMNRLLRKQGLIPSSDRQVAGAVISPVKRAKRDAEALTPEQLLEGVMTPEGRRRVLSSLAKSGAEPVKVSAIRALEEMDRQTGRQVGPGEPSSDEEYVERLGRLIYAAGSEIGGRAAKQALAQWKRDARTRAEGLRADEAADGGATSTDGGDAGTGGMDGERGAGGDASNPDGGGHAGEAGGTEPANLEADPGIGG